MLCFAMQMFGPKAVLWKLAYAILRCAMLSCWQRGAADVQAGRARMSEAPHADSLSLSIELDYQVNPQGWC